MPDRFVTVGDDLTLPPAVKAPLSALPPRSTLTVVYASGWPARPTARTDIHVHWVGGPDVRPAGALTGDIHTPDQEV